MAWKHLTSVVALCVVALSTASAQETKLKSGEYHVTQTWSQETDFQRAYFVQVPATTDGNKLPVFIFLHGNGGSAKRAMASFTRRYPNLAAKYVTVFADGYQKSWNIVSERSKADDRGFIEAIIKKLANHDNVQANNFSVMGNSNGAALVNQIAIESRLPNVRNYLTGVSPLNRFQHDGKNFKFKGDDNNYQQIADPMTGIRLLNISGTEDELVPYQGGPSKHIPAKDNKLAFVDAEESIFLWAQQMGYEGQKLLQPTSTEGRLAVYRYLDGDVIHYKVNGEGHGATGKVSEQHLLEFLNANKANETKR